MTTLAVLILAFGGFGALALSMTKHHRDLFGRLPPRARKLRLGLGGWCLLAASAAPAIIDQGVTLGLVLWLGLATVAALAVAMGLTYAPRARPAAEASSRSDQAVPRPKAESLIP